MLITLAPVIFVAHFLEESPGFVSWFNQHVTIGITSGLFWNVNISALVITLIIVFPELIEPSLASASLIILWFSVLSWLTRYFTLPAP